MAPTPVAPLILPVGAPIAYPHPWAASSIGRAAPNASGLSLETGGGDKNIGVKDLNAKAARAWPISGTAHRRTPALELATARCHPSSRLSWPTRRALTIILKSGKSGVLFVNSRKTAWYPLEDAVTSNSVTRKGTEMEWEEALLVAWGAEMPQQPGEKLLEPARWRTGLRREL